MKAPPGNVRNPTTLPAAVCAGAAVLAFAAAPLHAQSLPVPNPSFESPTVPPGFPALTAFDSWQKAPPPSGFPDPTQWDNLAGIFPNAPVGDPRHIENADGNQVAFLFPVLGVSLYQEVSSVFEVGKSYELTLGLRGGGALAAGVDFAMSLYYSDAGNRVPVASTLVTSTADYVTTRVLFDIEVQSAVVQAGDAWAGRNIGIELRPAENNTTPGIAYWEADKVRVTAVPEPGAAALLAAGLLVHASRGRRSLSRH